MTRFEDEHGGAAVIDMRAALPCGEVLEHLEHWLFGCQHLVYDVDIGSYRVPDVGQLIIDAVDWYQGAGVPAGAGRESRYLEFWQVLAENPVNWSSGASDGIKEEDHA